MGRSESFPRTHFGTRGVQKILGVSHCLVTTMTKIIQQVMIPIHSHGPTIGLPYRDGFPFSKTDKRGSLNDIVYLTDFACW